GRVVRAAAAAVVEDDQRAVLQVVDPALRLSPLVRRVVTGRDRAPAGSVEVVPGCRRTVGIALHGPDGDVRVAHVLLLLTQPRATAGGRGCRDRVHERGAGICLLGRADIE